MVALVAVALLLVSCGGGDTAELEARIADLEAQLEAAGGDDVGSTTTLGTTTTTSSIAPTTSTTGAPATTTTAPPAVTVQQLPWLMTADALGPIELGGQVLDLAELTGWDWGLEDSRAACTWHVSNDVGVQAQSGVIVEIWAMSDAVAVTPEGFAVGQTITEAGSAFSGRVGFVGPGLVDSGSQVILIDTVQAPPGATSSQLSWQEDFTYLLVEEPGGSGVIGTIRINDDGAFIGAVRGDDGGWMIPGCVAGPPPSPR
jgi:hypothetical protein